MLIVFFFVYLQNAFSHKMATTMKSRPHSPRSSMKSTQGSISDECHTSTRSSLNSSMKSVTFNDVVVKRWAMVPKVSLILRAGQDFLAIWICIAIGNWLQLFRQTKIYRKFANSENKRKSKKSQKTLPRHHDSNLIGFRMVESWQLPLTAVGQNSAKNKTH